MTFTDQQIIEAATEAGMCWPDCWALTGPSSDWGDMEHERMAKLRRFAELLMPRIESELSTPVNTEEDAPWLDCMDGFKASIENNESPC